MRIDPVTSNYCKAAQALQAGDMEKAIWHLILLNNAGAVEARTAKTISGYVLATLVAILVVMLAAIAIKVLG